MSESKYKLYYSPGTCSLAVHAVLNAVGANFELVSVAGKANRSEDYLKLNPLGQVPVLLEDGKVLRESAAIIIHLLEKFRHPLLPASGEARVKTIQWLLFFNSTMHQAYGAYFLISKNITASETTAPVLNLISKRIQKLWRYVEAEINSEYLCGDAPTAADILMAVIANWCQAIKPMPVPGPKVKAICARVIKLPYFAKALKTEGVKYS
jgi:glutathione S-transferase